jgi:dihydrofolate reductase
MRKFIVQQWVTLDSIAAEEGGGLSFVTAKPFAMTTEEDIKANVMEFIDTVDTMILGANTYAMSKDYWPIAKDQGAYGEKVNRLTKFVASTKLRDAPWGTFPAATITRDPVATIRELKQQSGKAIWLWGSLTLMQSMFDAGVVDEVQLRVCPTTRGKGTYIFKDRRDMHLIEARSFENGIVLLRYDIKK